MKNKINLPGFTAQNLTSNITGRYSSRATLIDTNGKEGSQVNLQMMVGYLKAGDKCSAFFLGNSQDHLPFFISGDGTYNGAGACCNSQGCIGCEADGVCGPAKTNHKSAIYRNLSTNFI